MKRRREEAGESVKAVPSAVPCFLAQALRVGCHFSYLGRSQQQGESALILCLSWLQVRNWDFLRIFLQYCWISLSNEKGLA